MTRHCNASTKSQHRLQPGALVDGAKGDAVVAAGLHVEKKERQFEADHDGCSATMLKALAARLAERFAECLHQGVPTEFWSHAPSEQPMPEGPIAERYRGMRQAPGYPACPDRSVKRAMFEVLQASDIGMCLTESPAMTPAASASGFCSAHPDATSLNVGRIGGGQLPDWAARQAIDADIARRLLAPALGQDGNAPHPRVWASRGVSGLAPRRCDTGRCRPGPGVNPPRGRRVR